MRIQYLVASVFLLAYTSYAAAQTAAHYINAPTVLGTIYCIDEDFLPTLNTKIAELRKTVRAERAKSKIVGYISIPLSSAGGGIFDVNASVSNDVKQRLEKLYDHRIWMLAPGAVEATIPKVNGKSARGEEYLYMWTEVLAGENGRGADFELFYFVGRSDFWNTLGVTSENSQTRLSELADKQNLTGNDKANFILYYTFRATALSSKGAHDEWNLLQKMNEIRRKDPKYGVAAQIASFYDGRPVELDDVESAISVGYEGRCNN